MKFKVGDIIKGISTGRYLYTNAHMTRGKVVAIYNPPRASGKDIRVKILEHDNRPSEVGLEYDVQSEYFSIAESPAQKVLITTDGTTTLARLYEGEKVVKSAEAKCSPKDTYAFATGAGLAYDRLMGRIGKPAETADKPAYKAGDKVRVIGNTCSHDRKIGDIITLTSPCVDGAMESNRPAWNMKESSYYISERDFEPYVSPVKPEPAQEPIKLYCVKDYKPGEWVTAGKIYEANCYGFVTFDDGYTPKYTTDIQRIYLVPLVKRPAKVGEWVYVTKTTPLTCHERKVGDIFKIDGTRERVDSKGFIWGSGLCPGDEDDCGEYRVLDGYCPEPEPKEMTVGEICDKLGYPVKVIKG